MAETKTIVVSFSGCQELTFNFHDAATAKADDVLKTLRTAASTHGGWANMVLDGRTFFVVGAKIAHIHANWSSNV